MATGPQASGPTGQSETFRKGEKPRKAQDLRGAVVRQWQVAVGARLIGEPRLVSTRRGSFVISLLGGDLQLVCLHPAALCALFDVPDDALAICGCDFIRSLDG